MTPVISNKSIMEYFKASYEDKPKIYIDRTNSTLIFKVLGNDLHCFQKLTGTIVVHEKEDASFGFNASWKRHPYTLRVMHIDIEMENIHVWIEKKNHENQFKQALDPFIVTFHTHPAYENIESGILISRQQIEQIKEDLCRLKLRKALKYVVSQKWQEKYKDCHPIGLVLRSNDQFYPLPLLPAIKKISAEEDGASISKDLSHPINFEVDIKTENNKIEFPLVTRSEDGNYFLINLHEVAKRIPHARFFCGIEKEHPDFLDSFIVVVFEAPKENSYDLNIEKGREIFFRNVVEPLFESIQEKQTSFIAQSSKGDSVIDYNTYCIRKIPIPTQISTSLFGFEMDKEKMGLHQRKGKKSTTTLDA